MAATWNLLWCIQMELKHPELCDVPWKEKEEAEDLIPIRNAADEKFKEEMIKAAREYMEKFYHDKNVGGKFKK